ncbi:MAG: ribulose-phosphate 3-epimerase [Bacilli bacterium]|nr:ribulose-phosphate 3-epimerase [Bacilli bacterium]
MSSVSLAPSILSADFSRIEEEVLKVAKAGAEFIHLDVMDGVFVPAKTFGPELVQRIVPFTANMLRDTHLMVEDPEALVDGFASAGSQLITFHYESYDNDEKRWSCLRRIKSKGVKVGMSIKPATSPEALEPFLRELDLVLVMSVEPGKGGQAFMESAFSKIAYYRKAIDAIGKHVYLEVDGGINEKTGRICVDFGADVLVAGSYIFGHDDYEDRMARLRK